MAQQETYGNWLGPTSLQRQPGIYSVASRMSPMGDFRPASPDSFDADYDDVSLPGSERGPPGKGVYLLAGPPGSSRSPSPKEPENSDPNSRDLTPKFRDQDPNSRDFAPKSQDLPLNSLDFSPNSRDFSPAIPDPAPRLSEFPDFGRNSRDLAPRRCRRSLPLAALALLLALGGTALLALGMARQQEMRAELELLKSNLSELWDSVQQEQTQLQKGMKQQQLGMHELTELLCRTLAASRCPPGWTSHGRGCFWFSRRTLSWAGAGAACAELGAHLAVVGSGEEQVFLLENTERGTSYWLGVTDAGQKGRWRWVTGEEPNFGFWDVWMKDPEKEQKDCGALGPKGRWVKELCTESHHWICEKPGIC